VVESTEDAAASGHFIVRVGGGRQRERRACGLDQASSPRDRVLASGGAAGAIATLERRALTTGTIVPYNLIKRNLYSVSRRMPMPTPREIFERYRDCVLHKDWQAFGDLLAEDAVMEFPFVPPCAPPRYEGREVIRSAAREGWGRVPLQFEEFRSVVLHDGRDAELLIAEYELCGTTVPAGESFRFPMAIVLRVRDGLIASIREYLHLIEMARLTGRAPAIAAYLMTSRSGPTPRELWESALRCYQMHDVDRYAAMFTPDGVIELPFTVPGLPGRLTGPDEIYRTLAPLWRASRDSGRRAIRYEPVAVHTTCDPDVIVAEFEVVGEDGSGAAYRLPYVHVVRVRDGRIALLRDYVDSRRIAERLAAMTPDRAAVQSQPQ
jgi:ketosteroid isomerase-like protein